jgi:hypothetical protein
MQASASASAFCPRETRHGLSPLTLHSMNSLPMRVCFPLTTTPSSLQRESPQTTTL